MRIALVTRSFSPLSGVGRVVSELARYYKDQMGHEVHIVLPAGEAVHGDYEIHPVSMVKYTFETRNLSFFLRSGALLRREKFDVAHLHAPCRFDDGIVTCHGVARIGMNLIKTLSKSHRKEVPLLYRLRIMLSYPMSDYNYRRGHYRKVIALSREIRDFLLSYYKVPEDAVELLPNGVDLAAYNPVGLEELRLPTRSRHGISETDFTFLFVGNFFKRKGLAFAIEALARIKRPHARLLVVGKDQVDQVRFEDYARELGVDAQVIFAGASLDTRPYYAAADAFLFPSFYDAYPLVNLEAMSSGLPIITSMRTGTVDILRDGENGLIVTDPTDAEELARKMLVLLEEPALRESMAAEARKTMEAYSWETIGRRTLEIYREIQR
ncbi:MAG: glycosyltransferase family 4 protein [Candidatus Eisenbacteria bacterium]